jgi:TetR/AcrR family transcriptional regulator, cholesterol catabolism regulator
MATTTADADQKKGRNGRSKKDAILSAAVSAFGEFGYETTKWSIVADRVGIGQTALYHYFESKAHCLLTIMRLQLERDLALFQEAVEGRSHVDGLKAAIATAYDQSDHDVLQVQILQRHMDLLAHPRGSEREEQERLAARDLVRQVEEAWTTLLREGMDQGAFRQQDPKLASRIVLGMVLSIWSWYNPKVGRKKGGHTLDALATEIQDACLRILAP